MNETEQTPSVRTVGRNEPCPCKSGKKYKRCHGVDAAPVLSTPRAGHDAMSGAALGGAPGQMPFDPSQLDPEMMSTMTKALQRLPRGQMQRLQGVMRKAMAGKDVTREAEELTRTLPPDFQQMMMGFQAMAAGMGVPSNEAPAMSESEAKALVAKAIADGKINESQGRALLGQTGVGSDVLTTGATVASTPESKGLGKLWNSIRGKK